MLSPKYRANSMGRRIEMHCYLSTKLNTLHAMRNTHRVYTWCLNSARCVYVCVWVCMCVCTHTWWLYCLILTLNSSTSITPTPPHLPNCSSVNKAMWTQSLWSTTMNTCLELTRSAQLWFSWSESEGHLSGSPLSLWNDLNQNSLRTKEVSWKMGK